MTETSAATERHPASRLGETLGRLPSYLRLTRALLADKRLGKARKAGLAGGLAYLASPIDLVPGLIPVLGQLDDLAVVFMALRFALKGLPGPAADALLADAGLSRDLLVRDLENVRATAGWAVRGAGRVGSRVAVTGARIGGRVATTGARTAARVAGVGIDAAGTGLRRLVRLRGRDRGVDRGAGGDLG
jgi:uncharacterized membrane protein YkvA (DUF1232 family)